MKQALRMYAIHAFSRSHIGKEPATRGFHSSASKAIVRAMSTAMIEALTVSCLTSIPQDVVDEGVDQSREYGCEHDEFEGPFPPEVPDEIRYPVSPAVDPSLHD